MTALQLITRSMRALGALASGEQATNAEAQDGLVLLNDMIDSWAAERLMIYVVSDAEYPLTAGVGTYTIGPTGTFVQARPMTVEQWSCVDYTNPAEPVELPVSAMSAQEWQATPVKNVQSALVTHVSYDPTFPNGTIDVWPIPNHGALKLKVYSPQALTAFANLTTNYTFPPGYAEALVYNHALRYAPELGRPVPAEVAEMARRSIAIVKRANITAWEMDNDPALLGTPRSFDWRIG